MKKTYERKRRGHSSTVPLPNRGTVTNRTIGLTDKGNTARRATFAEPLESQGSDSDNKSISSEDSNKTLEQSDELSEQYDESSEQSDQSSEDSEGSREDFDEVREVSNTRRSWLRWW